MLYKYLIDPFERAASTFVEQFVMTLLATGGVTLLVTHDYLVAADTAGFAGLIALVTSYILILTGFTVVGYLDLIRRVVLTFIQSVAGTLTASVVAPSVVHAPWAGAVALALPVTLVALLKAIAALALPSTHGASVAPKPVAAA